MPILCSSGDIRFSTLIYTKTYFKRILFCLGTNIWKKDETRHTFLYFSQMNLKDGLQGGFLKSSIKQNDMPKAPYQALAGMQGNSYL